MSLHLLTYRRPTGRRRRYDGQIWVKSPEVLSRDRLLGNYKVKPTLARMKNTMVVTAAMLAFSSLVLTGVLFSESDEDKMARNEPQVTRPYSRLAASFHAAQLHETEWR
jgi:hypothetical protein